MKNEFDIIIEKGRIERNYWSDLWRFRELFIILSWRDIKVRYKQTIIGAAWSIIRPLLTMIVFTVVFGKVAKLSTESDAPYAIMVFAGLLPWQFFANSLSEASNSLVGNTNLITKVYFPRLIVPASAVITSFVDFAISFLIMLVMMIYYSYYPSWQIVALPMMLVLSFVCSFGISLYITALNVKYRDFRYIIPFIVQFGLYISPVGFSSSNIPDTWVGVYELNPVVGIVDGFRWCLLHQSVFPWSSVLKSVLISSLFMAWGIWYFRRTEKTFADNI